MAYGVLNVLKSIINRLKGCICKVGLHSTLLHLSLGWQNIAAPNYSVKNCKHRKIKETLLECLFAKYFLILNIEYNE